MFAQPPNGVTLPTSEVARYEIPAERIDALRDARRQAWDSLEPMVARAATAPVRSPNTSSFAWHLLDGTLDPLATAFPHLRLREGYHIRAYVLFRRGKLTGGLPFAARADVSPPEPWSCIEYSVANGTPQPYFDGMSVFLDALQDGPDEPEVYLCASLFARDVWNFAGGPDSWRQVMKTNVSGPAVLTHHRVGKDETRYLRLVPKGQGQFGTPSTAALVISDTFNPGKPASLDTPQMRVFDPNAHPLPEGVCGLPRRERAVSVYVDSTW